MIKKTMSIENKINIPKVSSEQISSINTQAPEININNLNVEETEIETVPLTLSGAITSFPLKNNEIDFSRIAYAPEAVQNKNFINEDSIQKENWNENLSFQIGNNNIISIYNGNTLLGFTDSLGIEPLVNHTVLTPINTNQIISGNYSAQETDLESFKNDLNIQPGEHRTSGNTTYNITPSELNQLTYVVEAESNGTFKDALATISVIANRMEDPRFKKNNYQSLVDIVSQEGQFAVWNETRASNYNAETGNPEVLKAIQACLYGGLRNNDYVEFKARTATGNDKVQISPNGNKYHNLAVSLDRKANTISNIDANINPQ